VLVVPAGRQREGELHLLGLGTAQEKTGPGITGCQAEADGKERGGAGARS